MPLPFKIDGVRWLEFTCERCDSRACRPREELGEEYVCRECDDV